MFKFFIPNFSQRILLIALSGFLVSTIVITLVILNLVRHDSRNVLLKQQNDMGQMLALRLKNTILMRKQLLEKFTEQLSDGRRLLTPKVIQLKLNSMVGLHHLYNGGMLVLDANAISIADSPSVKGRTGIDFSDRAHVKEVHKSGATVITRATIGRGLKLPVFAIDAPIKSKSGKILGYIFGVTRLANDNLFQKIGKEFLGGQSSFMLIDPNLRIFITASDPALTMNKLPQMGKNLIVDKVLSGVTSGYVRANKGHMVLFTATKFNLMGLQIIHSLTETAIQPNERNIFLKLSLLVVGFSLLIALAVWLLLHRQLKVLRNTSDAIGEMVEGKRPYQILPVQMDDEIGKLITAFNQLQHRLSENIETLKETNLELEERVQQRSIKMKDAMVEAKRANKAKSEFLANMSHELRTPLNAILGFAQLLELDEEQFTLEQQGGIQEILLAGDHLTRLVTDILDLAKIESGHLEISMERVNLNDAVQQSVKLIRPQAEQQQITVIDKLFNKDHFVYADFTRLKQVLINLLSNAVKYNCVKGSITIDSIMTDKQSIIINISDTGNGLTELEMSKLFTPFERLNTLNHVEGTGIGLVIVKQWVELMGGAIGVKSTIGEGSTFWVKLILFDDTIKHNNP